MAKDGKKKNKAAEGQPDPWASNSSTGSSNADSNGLGAPAEIDDLAGPGEGDRFTPEDHDGHLLLITPMTLEEGIQTSYGSKSAIKADIVVLNPTRPDRSDLIKEGLIFPAVLQGQLQQALSRRTRVVGTLFKDTAAKKAGQNAPWKLAAPSDGDLETAKAYLRSVTR